MDLGYAIGKHSLNPRVPLPLNLTAASDQLNRLNVDALWRAHQRAVELDLAERSPASRILRMLAFSAWRSEFLGDGAGR